MDRNEYIKKLAAIEAALRDAADYAQAELAGLNGGERVDRSALVRLKAVTRSTVDALASLCETPITK